ncbi:MAG: nicotinamidase-related amidase [Motiliproteus sp.]|jgi:nicotinamidase-related amidase
MSQPTKRALLVIDPQNDYLPGGKFPLWNTEISLNNIEVAINRAQRAGDPVVLIQHVADATLGIAPFFNEGTEGAAIYPRILALAPDAPVIVKAFADSFHHTNLEATLAELKVGTLLICGMMTQNCVIHTAISKAAERYQVSILEDCCTTVDPMIHKIALRAVSTRCTLASLDEALPAGE